ncbi:MAG: transcription termination factor NusA [Simkaniaceae bacterium]
MNKDLVAIFEYLEREKGIKREIVVSAIEDSLLAAARKSKGASNISVKVDPKTGEIELTTEKEVVEKVEYPEEEISVEEAQELVPDCHVGDYIRITTVPEDFGRIAAQTARQVISQKLRGAERDVIYEEYRHRLHEIVSGTIKRIGRGGALIVDLGKVEAVMPDRFYPRSEKYHIGERVSALLYEVRDTENGGAEVILSRTHPEFVAELFKNEVPELSDGVVEIRKIVREAGYRTKMTVSSDDPKVDPVGACVGVRGTRVKNIIRELNNEKIDIIPFSKDPIILLENALAPIQIRKYKIDEEEKIVSIVVEDEDYPAVLGKKGFNARLTGELIGLELEVKRMSEYHKTVTLERQQLALAEDPALDEPLKVEGLSKFVIDSLISAGFDTPRKILAADPKELAKTAEISTEMVEDILEKIRKERIKSIG